MVGCSLKKTTDHYYNENASNPFIDKEATVIAEANKRTPTDVLLSSWSPPATYKSNKSIYNYGTKATLDTVNGKFVYGPYAKWWYNSLLEYKKRGVAVKYVSMQNEPNWAPSYEACIFMPKEQLTYDDSLKRNVKVASFGTAFSHVYDTIFKYKDSLPMMPRMLGPELFGIEKAYSPHLPSYTANMDLTKCYGINHHLYTGGNTKYAQTFVSNLTYINTVYPTKPKFQTEFSTGNWFFTAGLIQNSLIYEKAAGYLVWCYSWPNNSTSLVSIQSPFDSAKWTNKNGFTVTKTYYAVKQFSKFIRPDWRMVGITPSDSVLSASAFISPDTTQMSVVVVCNSRVSKTISIDSSIGFTIGSGKLYVTDSTKNCALVGTYTAKQKVVLTPSYSYTDPINTKSNLFYRIKIVTPDGKSSYSNVALLKNNTELRSFCIKPNPAHYNIVLTGNGLKKVSISDVSGKVMFTKSLNADISENTIKPTLSQGVYWVNVMFEDGSSQVEKVVYFP